MKLELKHLAPYLPYNIKTLWVDFEDDENIIGMMSYLDSGYKCLGNETGEYRIEECKPILRPLSDLTKEIEVNGEKFVPLNNLWNETLEQFEDNTYDDHFFNSDLKTTWISSENVLQLEYIVVQKLIEWNFDVFGLIENNLAIDINTLKS